MKLRHLHRSHARAKAQRAARRVFGRTRDRGARELHDHAQPLEPPAWPGLGGDGHDDGNGGGGR